MSIMMYGAAIGLKGCYACIDPSKTVTNSFPVECYYNRSGFMEAESICVSLKIKSLMNNGKAKHITLHVAGEVNIEKAKFQSRLQVLVLRQFKSTTTF